MVIDGEKCLDIVIMNSVVVSMVVISGMVGRLVMISEVSVVVVDM